MLKDALKAVVVDVCNFGADYIWLGESPIFHSFALRHVVLMMTFSAAPLFNLDGKENYKEEIFLETYISLKKKYEIVLLVNYDQEKHFYPIFIVQKLWN